MQAVLPDVDHVFSDQGTEPRVYSHALHAVGGDYKRRQYSQSWRLFFQHVWGAHASVSRVFEPVEPARGPTPLGKLVCAAARFQ